MLDIGLIPLVPEPQQNTFKTFVVPALGRACLKQHLVWKPFWVCERGMHLQTVCVVLFVTETEFDQSCGPESTQIPNRRFHVLRPLHVRFKPWSKPQKRRFPNPMGKVFSLICTVIIDQHIRCIWGCDPIKVGVTSQQVLSWFSRYP